MRMHNQLRDFYTSNVFKTKAMHLKQAHQSALDKSAGRLCSAAGLGTKFQQCFIKPFFVVGDGHFGMTRGPTLHGQFVDHLKKKVRYCISQGGRNALKILCLLETKLIVQ